MTHSNEKIDISVVVPVFNEQELIQETARRLISVLDRKKLTYELIFVDDGSNDQSVEKLQQVRVQHPGRIKILMLGRNFGHQLAITAGLRVSCGRAVIVIDADLQDPPEVILQFIDAWENGYQVVYGIRSQRKGETFFKKITADLFYRLIRVLTNIDIPKNVGDFYLLDRKVVEILNKMEEQHRFLRGLIVWVGFKRLGIEYKREPRLAGKTKFGLWRMVKFAFDAATSFSFVPLRLISFVGFMISLTAFGFILVIIYLKMFTNTTVVGWASIMAVVLFLGGIQMLSIGLIGEYVARIGDDIKHRPLYTVREFLE